MACEQLKHQDHTNTGVRLCLCTKPSKCINSCTGTIKPSSKQREFKKGNCSPPFIPSSLEHSGPSSDIFFSHYFKKGRFGDSADCYFGHHKIMEHFARPGAIVTKLRLEVVPSSKVTQEVGRRNITFYSILNSWQLPTFVPLAKMPIKPVSKKRASWYLSDSGWPEREVSQISAFWKHRRPQFSLCPVSPSLDRGQLLKVAQPQIKATNKDDIQRKVLYIDVRVMGSDNRTVGHPLNILIQAWVLLIVRRTE